MGKDKAAETSVEEAEANSDGAIELTVGEGRDNTGMELESGAPTKAE